MNEITFVIGVILGAVIVGAAILGLLGKAESDDE